MSGLGSAGKVGVGVGAIAAAHFLFGPKDSFILCTLGFTILGLQQTKKMHARYRNECCNARYYLSHLEMCVLKELGAKSTGVVGRLCYMTKDSNSSSSSCIVFMG